MGGNPCCNYPGGRVQHVGGPGSCSRGASVGLPIEQLSCGETVLSAEDIEYVVSPGTPVARFAVECNSQATEAYRIQTGETGTSLPDRGHVCRSGFHRARWLAGTMGMSS
jgi:purine nucleosidase